MTSKEVNSIQASSKEEQFTFAVDSFFEIIFIILGSFVKTLLKSNSYKCLLHVCFEQYDALLNSDNYDKEKDIE